MKKMLQGSVNLPSSKSESNRALMIAAYGGFPPNITHLSEAHDTVLLQRLLGQIATADANGTTVVDCEDAGTVARFLLTYLACHEGSWLLTGTERLRLRPMKPLVEALNRLGADITCLKEDGQLPLRIQGRPLSGGEVVLDGSQSSQFASSLLLAAPSWEKGLSLTFEGETVSMPYLEMTLSMMVHFGAVIQQDEATIKVLPQPYKAQSWEVSADWSAASYWFELAALTDSCSILLKDLRDDSLQGDSRVVEIFAKMGVVTRFEAEGVRLSKAPACEGTARWEFDFSDYPDLFPAVFVTCVALHHPAVFRGIRHLALKESNRVESIISELSKLYTLYNIIEDHCIVVNKSLCKKHCSNTSIIRLDTHDDHRIAMALAPLMLLFPDLIIDCPEVVSKSYPDYWTEFELLTR